MAKVEAVDFLSDVSHSTILYMIPLSPCVSDVPQRVIIRVGRGGREVTADLECLRAVVREHVHAPNILRGPARRAKQSQLGWQKKVAAR